MGERAANFLFTRVYGQECCHQRATQRLLPTDPLRAVFPGRGRHQVAKRYLRVTVPECEVARQQKQKGTLLGILDADLAFG